LYQARKAKLLVSVLVLFLCGCQSVIEEIIIRIAEAPVPAALAMLPVLHLTPQLGHGYTCHIHPCFHQSDNRFQSASMLAYSAHNFGFAMRMMPIFVLFLQHREKLISLTARLFH